MVEPTGGFDRQVPRKPRLVGGCKGGEYKCNFIPGKLLPAEGDFTANPLIIKSCC